MTELKNIDLIQEQSKSEQKNSLLDKHHPEQQGDIIYVLRTTQQHHVMLSMIADQKANIVLGAFLIFITVTQSLHADQDKYLLPIIILSVFFTLAAIFSLFVITPRFRSPKREQGQPSNLLFFGSFSVLQQDEYIDALKEKLQNNEKARALIMKDIYQIGQVLNKKYTNLRLSYLSLGLGIASSTITFSLINLNIFNFNL